MKTKTIWQSFAKPVSIRVKSSGIGSISIRLEAGVCYQFDLSCDDSEDLTAWNGMQYEASTDGVSYVPISEIKGVQAYSSEPREDSDELPEIKVAGTAKIKISGVERLSLPDTDD